MFTMWHWFCARPEPVEVPRFGNIPACGNTVTAQYRVIYLFGSPKSQVNYVIRTNFELKNGLIVEQHDDGDINVWSRQALGPLASALSWIPILDSSFAGKREETRRLCSAQRPDRTLN